MCSPKTVGTIGKVAGAAVGTAVGMPQVGAAIGGKVAGAVDPIKAPISADVSAPASLNLPNMYPGSVNGMSGSAISPMSTPPPQSGNWQDMFLQLLKQFSGG
jgi:hypothetical protein